MVPGSSLPDPHRPSIHRDERPLRATQPSHTHAQTHTRTHAGFLVVDTGPVPPTMLRGKKESRLPVTRFRFS